MARGSEPVVDRSADAASLNRRSAGPVMTRDQQQHAVAASDCLLEATVNCCPGGVQRHAVQVEDTIGLYTAGAQLLVPAAIKRLLTDRDEFLALRRRSLCGDWLRLRQRPWALRFSDSGNI